MATLLESGFFRCGVNLVLFPSRVSVAGSGVTLGSVADTQKSFWKKLKPHRQLLNNIVAFKLRLPSYMATGLQVEVTSSLAEVQESQANCKLLVVELVNYCSLGCGMAERSKIGFAMAVKA